MRHGRMYEFRILSLSLSLSLSLFMKISKPDYTFMLKSTIYLRLLRTVICIINEIQKTRIICTFAQAGQHSIIRYLDSIISHTYIMSCAMRKPYFSICKSKDADQHAETAQLISAFVFGKQIVNLSVVQSLDFRIRNFKHLISSNGCAARFVSELVGNPEDRVSHGVVLIFSNPRHLKAGAYLTLSKTSKKIFL